MTARIGCNRCRGIHFIFVPIFSNVAYFLPYRVPCSHISSSCSFSTDLPTFNCEGAEEFSSTDPETRCFLFISFRVVIGEFSVPLSVNEYPDEFHLKYDKNSGGTKLVPIAGPLNDCSTLKLKLGVSTIYWSSQT